MDRNKNKIDRLTRRLADCNKELREVKRQLKTNELNEFRRMVTTPPESSARKRRKNRASTPNNFWNLDF
jgi:hypothetical protein